MRTSRTERDPAALFNLDSLMDIVTNVLGALFFVVVFVVLSSTGAKGRVTTPLAQPIDTEPFMVECRGNTVIIPEYDELGAQVIEMVNRLIKSGVTDPHEWVRRVKDANIHNRYHHVEVSVQPYYDENGEIKIDVPRTYVPDLGALGETALDLKSAESVLRRRLARLDPAKRHVFFIVRTDSYEVFHSARRLAMEMGFRTGKDPLGAGDSLTFGASGVPLWGD